MNKSPQIMTARELREKLEKIPDEYMVKLTDPGSLTVVDKGGKWVCELMEF